MRCLKTLALIALLAAPVFAADVAELRNGFNIPHRTREVRDGLVRLFLDEQRTAFVDIPTVEIVGYHWEADAVEVASLTALPAADPTAPPKDTQQIVAEASERQGVDADFIRSVIRQESGGNPRAVSRTGARGLMQLMPGTAQQLGVKDSFSAEQNVHGGAQYLRELLERYHGDAILALAAYNAGPQAVERYHGVPPYSETRKYVRRVVHDYNRSKGAVSTETQKQPAAKSTVAKSTAAKSSSSEKNTQAKAETAAAQSMVAAR